jgi:hypothetical protein
MVVGLHDGSYPVISGEEIKMDGGFPSRTDAILYDTSAKDYYGFPDGAPTLRITGETLDPPFGDATGDGRIDISDFGTLKDGFGQPTTPYQNGDLTGNLSVDMTDFGILKQNFGWRQASAVPEPSALGLLGFGFLCFLLLAKQKNA